MVNFEAAEREMAEMDRLFDRLFPICRSITGEGLRQTLDILSEYMPLERFGVPTGTRVFDWEIPKEWNIREAWLKGPDGSIIADFRRLNLHVVNYSIPVNRRLSLEELRPHLHSIPHLPDAIPYVTSYYKPRWGFCLPHRVLERLPEGEYHACIDSELKDGELNYAHALLPGESEREVLISTYVCHPSMANNELSGPIVAAFLYRRIAAWKRRRWTYRFVFVPETIGSIAYLHRFGETLKRNVFAGFVLTCLGGDQPLSFKQSRRKDSAVNRIWDHALKYKVIEGRTRPFNPANGSDERQYCSPGFNLPVGQLARMLYGSYPGYHNSLDTKEIMTIEALHRSVDEIELLLKSLEADVRYLNRFPYGEVKLDKHGLYPDMNSPLNWSYSTNEIKDQRVQLSRILYILNYSDGEHSLADIAEKCGCHVLELAPLAELLAQKGILEDSTEARRAGNRERDAHDRIASEAPVRGT